MHFPSLPEFSRISLIAGWTYLLALFFSGSLWAQDRTVLYDVAGVGESKSIPTWGLDTAWLSDANVRRGVIFMGQPQVDVIRFSFTGDTTVAGGNLTNSGLTEFNQRMAIVNSYTDSHTKLYLNNDTDTLDPYYQGSGGVNATTWAQLINVTRSNCVYRGRTVLSVSPFNEPDYATWQGNVTRFGQVCFALRTTYGASFTGINLCGGNTLNNDQASTWYNTLNASGYLEQGNTHQLAGSFNNYASFYQTVKSNGDVGVNDELHNVMEAMVGAEYGMGVGIWWGTAERARGEFVKSSDGQRLAYAEHRPNWTAASVYRSPSGAVQAFVGESERQALPTTYRFFSKDRDVFYDGDGPRRDYTVTTTGGPGYWTEAHKHAEAVINITWGADVQPLISGRYIIVARHSYTFGKAMEVAGNSTADGANIQQNAYSGGLNQQWDVAPMPKEGSGDYSYFSIIAAHSGKPPDVNNFSYNDGANVQQWGMPGSYPGDNQQWFLEYAGNGWFYIRSRWSGKYLDVSGVSTANGATIHQWSGTGGLNQQWRFIPVGENLSDATAPSTVSGVSATASARSVRLSWTANTETDLAGYIVLRSTNSGGPYETVARGSMNNFFSDKSANRNKTYYYYVKAMDKCWNTSDNSIQVSATPTGDPALIARYKFDGDTSDSSTNANHMIIVNGSPSYPVGTNGTSLGLAGASGQYTMLPANLLAGVTNFTIGVWVYWTGAGLGDWQRVLDFGNGTTEYLFLTPWSSGGKVRFAITTNSFGAEQAVEAPGMQANVWRHLTVTYNGSMLSLYTNGVLADAKPGNISPASFNPALNYLGDSQWEGDAFFSGRLDDMFIYNYALNPGEIAQLMAGGLLPAVPSGLAATPGDNQIGLTWNASSGATSYNVKRSTTSGSGHTTIASPATTSYTDTTAGNGTNYYYVVSAFDISGESANSAQVAARPVSVSPVNTACTQSNGLLTVLWPLDHLGWRMQVQTNGLASNGWYTVPGSSSTNVVVMPLNSNASIGVFYRLIYP